VPVQNGKYQHTGLARSVEFETNKEH